MLLTADLGANQEYTLPLSVQFFKIIFMQFFAKNIPNNRFTLTPLRLTPFSGKYWIRNWLYYHRLQSYDILTNDFVRLCPYLELKQNRADSFTVYCLASITINKIYN